MDRLRGQRAVGYRGGRPAGARLRHTALSSLAELVIPAVRWDSEQGFQPAREAIESALKLGVGGFIIFGGVADAVRKLTRELNAASRVPLLIGSDLERGAGQQVEGLTLLPPFRALATLGEPAVRDAARLTAIEASGTGMNWAFSPVLDLDIEPMNPIVQTRALGGDPATVAALGTAWIESCQAEGVLACAKHFPGHGRTTADSHSELPVIGASAQELEADLAPFRVAGEAGVASIMTAHVAYPALDSTARAATYSRPIITGLLRQGMGYDGLVVTDALIMRGAFDAAGPMEGALRAMRAGCDLLLYPDDFAAATRRLERAVSEGELPAGWVDRSRARRNAASRKIGGPAPQGAAEVQELARRASALAARSMSLVRGEEKRLGPSVHIEVVDDDAGGPYDLPSRSVVAKALWAAGVDVRPDGEQLVLLFADVKSWKGRAGLSDVSRQRLAHLLTRNATVVLFGHPRRLSEIPGSGSVYCAWSGDEVMQRAAADRLMKGTVAAT